MDYGHPRIVDDDEIYGAEKDSLNGPDDINAGEVASSLRNLWISVQEEGVSEETVEEFIQISDTVISSYESAHQMGARAGDQNPEFQATPETDYIHLTERIMDEIDRNSVSEEYRDSLERIEEFYEIANIACSSAYWGTASDTNKTVSD